MFPLAVISDIHGNRWALEAVLEDIQGKNIRHIVNLGDSFYGPLDPEGTAAILLDLDIPSVCGNEDQEVFETDRNGPVSGTLTHTRQSLSDHQVNWLRSLQMTLSPEKNVLMFHGTPENNREYLFFDVESTGLVFCSTGRLKEKLGEMNHTLYLCGHDHTPNVTIIDGSRWIVNPGSVGLQAYTDDLPHPHIVENGSPNARYAVVSRENGGYWVDYSLVPYDHQSAADVARRNRRPDWAFWLQTGQAR